MKIDALMTTWDQNLPPGKLGIAGLSRDTDSPFLQMLSAIQGESEVSPVGAAALNALGGGKALPLTELLKMIEQFTGESGATADPIGELLLSSTTQKPIPLMEALAALQSLINHQLTVDGNAPGQRVTTEDEATFGDVDQKQSDDGCDIGLEVVVPLLSAFVPGAQRHRLNAGIVNRK